MKKIMFAATFAALVGFGGATSSAMAQDYPDKPVRLIVPYPPGGGNDLLARLLSERLSEKWQQQVVVENRPGAGATIGTATVAKAAPDGHTILLSSIASHAISPNLYDDPGYDPIKDFSAITLIAELPIVLVVNSKQPFNTVGELVDFAKKNPGDLTFGSAGNGSVTHLAGEMFKVTAGIDMLHVPYGGGGPSLVAAQAGDVAMVFEPTAGALTTMQGGRIKALAISRSERLPDHPQIPTFAEERFDDYKMATWYSLHAPAGTPRSIIDAIQQDVADILKNPDMQDRLKTLGADIGGGSPEELDALVRSELARYTELIQKAKARID